MRSRSDEPGRGERQGESSTGGQRGTAVSRGTGTGLARRSWLSGGPLALGSPWDLMRRATEEMERVLEAIDFGFDGGATRAGVTGWIPQVEVVRNADSMTVRVDLPGMDPDDINVTTEDGMLIVSGERTQEHREEEEGYVRSERRYGHFYRSIPLPEGADESNIKASFDKGVLEINVPISGRQSQGRRIPISSGKSGSQSRESQ